MALTFTQQKAYTSRMNIFRATRSRNAATGEVGDDVWGLVAANIPCAFLYTPNDSDPTGVGRIKRRTALTEDRIEMEVTVDIKDQDIVKDVTPGSPNAGTFHRVAGVPRLLESQGVRKTNHLEIQAMQEEKPPEGVS